MRVDRAGPGAADQWGHGGRVAHMLGWLQPLVKRGDKAPPSKFACTVCTATRDFWLDTISGIAYSVAVILTLEHHLPQQFHGHWNLVDLVCDEVLGERQAHAGGERREEMGPGGALLPAPSQRFAIGRQSSTASWGAGAPASR